MGKKKKKDIKFEENLRMGLSLVVGISAAVSCAITIIVLLFFVIASKLGIWENWYGKCIMRIVYQWK